MDSVDDAVISDTDTQEIVRTLYRFAAMGAWVRGEGVNLVSDALLDWFRETR